jgi:hypothetical protein
VLKDYESLRSYVLESVYDFSRPLGLDLFLKKGFLFWVKIQIESTFCHKPACESEQVIRKSEFLVQDLQQEITMLLANMILEGSSSNVSV